MTLSTRYDHQAIEPKWMNAWYESQLYQVHPLPGSPRFSIVIPPPNVTGSLHVGHALDNILQDIFVRWHRMRGHVTLWVPGMDHAGIATQTVIERQLAREGKTRFDLGREKFIEVVWSWKEEYANRIRYQLRRLGASCDWSHERFTLDEGFSRAVRTAFLRLYAENLIYRGEYIINWCPRCETALSDLEVEHKTVQGRLYWIRYPLKDPVDKRTHVVVATTRPETMLGDTAVAVHPDDERYRPLIGKTIILPLMNREIPIIADEHVNPEFGSGAVKVTPAHDPNDFEIGRRHHLPMINVMTPEAKMNEAAGAYAGLDRFEARKRIVSDLESLGLLEKVEPHTHAVGHCYRCGTVIEPRVSKQWFVRMKPLAERAIQAFHHQGRPRFIPENWGDVYMNWLQDIRDWCISRQIWWGHSIPAWHCSACGNVLVADQKPERCDCGETGLHPDPDVLDTWFSSALWPFGVFGWPDQTPDLEFFYPTNLLVTGFDIIFFWVARMVMMGLHFTDRVPFDHVLIHGLVRDEKGQKMSKTRGNVIDPMDVIEDMGADALRFTMARLAAPGMDVPFSLQQVQGYRTFMNKIWNATRFVLMHFEKDETAEPIDPANLDPFDRWILTRLNMTARDVKQRLEEYSVNESSRTIYNFFWNDFCDWYIEICKPDLRTGGDPAIRRKAVLVHVLDWSLRLLHPFIPFITEELWQKIPIRERKVDSISLAPYPEANADLIFENESKTVEQFMAVISKMRQVRSMLNVPPQALLQARLHVPDDHMEFYRSSEVILKTLAGLESVALEPPRREKGWVYDVSETIEFEINVGAAVDLEQEKARLLREIENLQRQRERIRARLDNPAFRSRANPEVVKETEKRYDELGSSLERIQRYLRELTG